MEYSRRYAYSGIRKFGQGRPVDEFEMDVRLSNCLRAMGITHSNQIAQTTKSEFMAQRNFGRMTWRHLIEMLTEYGLTHPIDE